MDGTQSDWSFSIEGRPSRPGEPGPDEEVRMVAPGFFQVMGIPVLRGRGIEDRDDGQAPEVAVINQALADKYFPGQEPLGRRISNEVQEGDPATPRWREVVGVVGNVRHFGLDRPAQPEYYVSLLQGRRSPREFDWVLRTRAPAPVAQAALAGGERDK